MSQTVSTLAVDVIANTGGLTDGLALTKRELREAAKIAEAATDPFTRLAAEQEKLARFARGGQLNAAQFATAMAQAEERFFPTLQEAKPKIFDAELVKTARDYIKPINFDAMKSANIDSLTKDVTSMNKAFGVTPFAIEPGTVAMRAMTIGSVALAGAVTAVGATVVNRMAEIDDIGDSAQRLGISISSLSSLRNAAFLGDVDPQKVDDAMTKLLTAVGKGDKGFAKIGLDVEKLRDMRPDQMFAAVAESIGKIPSVAGKMGAIGELGVRDKEIVSLMNRFKELSQAAADSGANISQGLGDKVGEADEAFKKLTLSARGFSNSLASISAGPLTKVMDATTALSKVGFFEQAAGFGTGMIGGSLAGGALSGALLGEREKIKQEAKEASESIRDAAADLAKSNPEEAKSMAKMFEANLEHEFDLERRIVEEQAEFEKEVQAIRVRDAIKAIDEMVREEERLNQVRARGAIAEIEAGERIAESMKTPAEATKDRLLADLDALRKSGLDNPETRDRLMRRAAGELARTEQGGFGAPGADKGTRAAREAIIGAQHQAEQSALMRRMVASLEALVAKDELEVVEISGP